MLASKETPAVDNSADYVRQAINLVHLNYRTTLRVEDLARNLNLDRAYFGKLFRKHTGKTPRRYIVEYRLKKAAELMVCQNMLTSDAAREVGYTDIFNFSKMFKQHYGVAPSMYKTYRQ
jgi:AraC-like DNA-binding protein